MSTVAIAARIIVVCAAVGLPLCGCRSLPEPRPLLASLDGRHLASGCQVIAADLRGAGTDCVVAVGKDGIHVFCQRTGSAPSAGPPLIHRRLTIPNNDLLILGTTCAGLGPTLSEGVLLTSRGGGDVYEFGLGPIPQGSGSPRRIEQRDLYQLGPVFSAERSARALGVIPGRGAGCDLLLCVQENGESIAETTGQAKLFVVARTPVVGGTARFGESLYGMIPARFCPWKFVSADVDSDGDDELIAGVTKTARFDPVIDNRLFVFDWLMDRTGNSLQPKWLGSRLSRRFTDFTYGDTDGDGEQELVAVEILDRGTNRIAVYGWTGFGYAAEQVSADLGLVSDPQVVDEAGGKMILAWRRANHRTKRLMGLMADGSALRIAWQTKPFRHCASCAACELAWGVGVAVWLPALEGDGDLVLLDATTGGRMPGT